MTRAPLETKRLRQAICARYRGADRWSRLQVRGRLLTWPFARALDHVPDEGLIATLGCGRGCFELAMLLGSTRRRVISSDLDPEKAAVARAAAGDLPLEIVPGNVLAHLIARDRRCDAIALVDVLYLVAPDQQAPLLRQALAALVPRGRLLIKETGLRPRWKALFNRTQEFLACHVLKLTRHQNGVVGFRTGDGWEQCLTELGFEDVVVEPVDRGYPYPHVIVTARAPGAPAGG